ncbi:MAG: FAD binding domain-containing protein [Synergistaceae bacterium]|nr:FAD binding domain-containing protein [Synergistaceae bacterium]
MIPCDFVYCKPDTLEEAAQAYRHYNAKDGRAFYYAGGSEVITMSRAGSVVPSAVIDIKGISECNTLEQASDEIVIGAANTLSRIEESLLFPLLGLACGRIADHTNQCRITLGGNLSGTIRYRETSLPLLLADAQAVLYSAQGFRTAPFQDAFHGKMTYLPGEFLVCVHVPSRMPKLPHGHIKKTKNEKIDYPLASVAALIVEGKLRVAFSGVYQYPFRSKEAEDALNDTSLSSRDRAEKAVGLLTDISSDRQSSAPYRAFVLTNTLEKIVSAWESGELEKSLC